MIHLRREKDMENVPSAYEERQIRRQILRKQLELLSEQSKNCMNLREVIEIGDAMVRIEEALRGVPKARKL